MKCPEESKIEIKRNEERKKYCHFALKPREIRDFTTNTKSLIINALKEAAIKAMNS